ncbi:MAG TPA: glycosyltransferase family 2 protein [Terriglobales bacterium]|nr:glycosyltransferase family 2 protein [Terriglobales bacterium]
MRNGSAVIVTYNSAGALRSCLASILNNPAWEVIVVDNASSDNPAQVVAEFPQVRFFRNDTNRGFAAAANQGAKLSSGNLIVLLNPDTVAEAGALNSLAAALAQEGVVAAGGALLDSSGRRQRGFQFRRFPTLAAMLAEVLLLNRIWPGNPWNRRYRCLDLDDSKPQLVEQPAGACLAVSREAWESIGGFDENFYPVWFEDVDFCRRLADRGWKIAYCPDARFTHAGGHSISKLPFRDKQAFWYANMLRYFSKHHGRLKTAILRAGILTGLALRSFASLIGAGPRDVRRKEALAGYAHAARIVVQRSASHTPSKHRVGVAAV